MRIDELGHEGGIEDQRFGIGHVHCQAIEQAMPKVAAPRHGFSSLAVAPPYSYAHHQQVQHAGPAQ